MAAPITIISLEAALRHPTLRMSSASSMEHVCIPKWQRLTELLYRAWRFHCQEADLMKLAELFSTSFRIEWLSYTELLAFALFTVQLDVFQERRPQPPYYVMPGTLWSRVKSMEERFPQLRNFWNCSLSFRPEYFMVDRTHHTRVLVVTGTLDDRPISDLQVGGLIMNLFRVTGSMPTRWLRPNFTWRETYHQWMMTGAVNSLRWNCLGRLYHVPLNWPLSPDQKALMVFTTSLPSSKARTCSEPPCECISCRAEAGDFPSCRIEMPRPWGENFPPGRWG